MMVLVGSLERLVAGSAVESLVDSAAEFGQPAVGIGFRFAFVSAVWSACTAIRRLFELVVGQTGEWAGEIII